MGLTQATLPHASALDHAGVALAAGMAAGKRPLALVDNASDRSALLRLAYSKETGYGMRVFSTRGLLAQRTLEQPQNLPLLTIIDCNSDLRNVATNTVLQAQIHLDLLRDSKLHNPMALAQTCRDLLVEMANDSHTSITDITDTHSQFAEEINLLQSLWHTYCESTQQQRKQQLTELAQTLQAPIAHVHWRKHQPQLLRKFLATAAQTADVHDLRIELDSVAQQLEQLWACDAPATDIIAPPMVCAAATLEDTATIALDLLTSWHAQGKHNIAVIGYDRLLVRRLHSLGLQRGIHIKDTVGGWRANNLLVGDVLLALVDPAQDRVSRLRLQQLLARSLHANHYDWASGVRAQHDARAHSNAVWQRSLEALQRNLHGQRRPLSAWFDELAKISEQTPLAEFFSDDVAGERLRNLLHFLTLASSQLDNTQPATLVEIRTLLHDALSHTHLLTNEVNSDIHLISPTHCSATGHDALLLLGANAKTLPSMQLTGLFNDEVREMLGLPTSTQRNYDLRIATAKLLAQHDTVAAVWHATTRCSPFLELLKPNQLQPPVASWICTNAASNTITENAAVINGLPTKISPSHCDTLMACPYKFHAETYLRLHKDDRQQEFNPAAFGSFVHRILDTFHKDWQPDNESANALLTLHAATKKVYANTGDTLTWLYRQAWLGFIDPYATLINQHIANGNTILASEHQVQQTIAYADQQLHFIGKVDRLDRYGDNPAETAVIDVKVAQDKTKYRQDVIAGELPQLSLYVSLTASNSALAAIWLLRANKGEYSVEPILPAEQFGNYEPQRIADHIHHLLAHDIATGSPLPANGIPKICAYCNYAGLCRKPLWGVPPTKPRA